MYSINWFLSITSILFLISFLLFFDIDFLLPFIWQSQLSSVDQMHGMNMSNYAAMEQTRMLANTLAQNADPKFQVYLLFMTFCISLSQACR